MIRNRVVMNQKRWMEYDLDHASKKTTFGDLGIGKRIVQK
jgi:hypothetical protein